MDYQALLFNPIYLVQGVACVLTLADTAGTVANVVVLDKTAGIDTGEKGPQVQTIRPAAVVRVAELATQGVDPDDLPKAHADFNGQSWTVVSFRKKPSPKGEGDGEIYLILKATPP